MRDSIITIKNVGMGYLHGHQGICIRGDIVMI